VSERRHIVSSPDLFPWEDGVPVRVANLLAPWIANLYLFGLLQSRGGAVRLAFRAPGAALEEAA
jgi:hypothetical protein